MLRHDFSDYGRNTVRYIVAIGSYRVRLIANMAEKKWCTPWRFKESPVKSLLPP